MFDNLVESSGHHEDSGRKSWFFLATTAIYAVLIGVLIVAGIKGADIYMDTQNLADLKLITPVVVEEAAPAPQQKAEPQKQTEVKMEQTVSTAREIVSERPEIAPKGVSVDRQGQSPPIPGAVKGNRDFQAPPSGSPFGDPNATGAAVATAPQPVVSDEPPPPPPAPKPTPTPRRAPISGGVLNGKAISLPKPGYPPIAKAARASGTVTVQVTIDESGKVVSARAVGGHPLLQQAAVQAAYGARFSPTQLSGQAVKVTGVITYNFVAQ
jgi:protein TonB